jgi:hypothetical protein
MENSNIEKNGKGIIRYPLFASAFLNSVFENSSRLSSPEEAGGI